MAGEEKFKARKIGDEEVSRLLAPSKNPFPVQSVDGFIFWLERQPANTTYNWLDIDDCITARYYIARTGENGLHSGVFGSSDRLITVAAGGHRSYGAALARAKAVAR